MPKPQCTKHRAELSTRTAGPEVRHYCRTCADDERRAACSCGAYSAGVTAAERYAYGHHADCALGSGQALQVPA